MMKVVLGLILILIHGGQSLGQEVEPNSSQVGSPGTEQVTNLTNSNAPRAQTDSSDYVYDPSGKKDPFKPYKAPRARGDNRPIAPIDPLLQVEVGNLELIAIMWNTNRPRAVLQDSSKKTFTVFKNSRIGRNDGIVVDIREGEVVIVEKFDDGLGNIVREARVLEMKIKTEETGNSAGG